MMVSVDFKPHQVPVVSHLLITTKSVPAYCGLICMHRHTCYSSVSIYEELPKHLALSRQAPTSCLWATELSPMVARVEVEEPVIASPRLLAHSCLIPPLIEHHTSCLVVVLFKCLAGARKQKGPELDG